MEEKRKVTISDGGDCNLRVTLFLEDSRQVAQIFIDGVAYHFERMKKSEFLRNYVIDNDSNYDPRTDNEGMCYLIAPYPRP